MGGLGTVIGSMVGFVAAVWPHVYEMWVAKATHTRNLEAKKMELDAAKSGLTFGYTPLSDEYTIADNALGVAEQHAIRMQDAEDTKGHPILEFIRSSVRPVLTYGFFLLFATIKLVALHHALNVDHVSVQTILPVLWDENTDALFAAVISFWFGSRAVSQMRAQRRPTKVVDSLKGHNNGNPVVGE